MLRVLPQTPEAIHEALRALRSGGVIAHATETCYGLACDITNADAVAQLFAIKQRPHGQPVSALFMSIEQAKEYVEWNDIADELSAKHLPGPLTIILPLKAKPPFLIYPTPPNKQINAQTTVGIRISSHPLAQELVERFGSPLTTTSANVSTLPSPYGVDEILEQFEGKPDRPDMVLDSGNLERIDASTVVDCSDGQIQIVRQGAILL